MRKTVNEILDVKQFDFYINPGELPFFIDKPKNQTTVMSQVQNKLSENYQNLIQGILPTADKLKKRSSAILEKNTQASKRNQEIRAELETLSGNQLGRKYELLEEQYRLAKEAEEIIAESKEIELILNNNDSFVTHENNVTLKQILKENAGLVNRDRLILYFGMLAKKYLNWIISAEKGTHKESNEFCYGNGEIITIRGNQVSMQLHDSLESLKSDLAEAVLIANQEIQSKNKNTQFSISGIYHSRGGKQSTTREQFSTKELADLAKSETVLSNIDFKKMGEYIDSGLVNKWALIKLMNKGSFDINLAIRLYEKGTLKQDELLKKVFVVNNFSELLKNKKLSLDSKLLLYSMDKIKIDELEKSAEKHIEKEDIISPETFRIISKYYSRNINKISELLTHNVLDFTQSMQFLDELRNSYKISDQEKEYLTDIMNDFKTKQLLNQTENGKIERGDKERTNASLHITKGVTIDPRIRREYLKSIGDVKDVFIKGQTLIQDDSLANLDGKTKRNSLDGYQVIIIPDKKVAILEKFYEVTRNKDGNVEYKKDEKGRLIPAVENATYIIPIGLAKDFCEKKNKQELIKSPYVRRASHTMNWVTNVESKIKVLNPKAEFEKENTNKWHKKVMDNYQELLENR